ncbi:MAG: DUF6263 family protein [Planctomycetota bacterium]
MFTARILPLALVLTAAAQAQEQGKTKHLLRFDFKPGTVAKQVMTQDMTMTMAMGAEDMVTKMTMSMFQTYTVQSVEGDKAAIEQKITRVKAVMDNPMMQVDYDSSDEDSDPGMLEGLADLVDSTIRMKLSNRGKPSDVKLPEEVSDAAGAGGPDLEQMISQIVTALPEQPVAIGETWTVDQDMAMGQMGDTSTKVTYKLLGVTDSEIMLEQSLKMDLSTMEVPPGMEVKDATAKGKITIDRRTGLPKTSVLDMTMQMDGPMAMTMALKVTLKPAPADKKAPVTGPKKDAPMVCVISGEDAEGGPTATFGGQTVGFCCKRCKAKWDQMDDAGRKQAVAKLGAGK